MKIGSAFVEIAGDSSKLNSAINASKNALNGFSNSARSSISSVTSSLVKLAAAAAGPAAAFKSVVDFSQYETAVSRMGNVTKLSTEEIKKNIASVPPSLGSATDLMKGYYQVISAGVQGTAKQMDMLTVSAQISKEAGIQQADVVRGLASFMGNYKEELKSSADAADLLYSIEKSGITTVQELIPHIGRMSGLSKTLGLDQRELAAAMAQVTASGAGTDVTMTQLQAVFQSLMNPTKEMSDLLGKYGGAQLAIKQLGFAGVLQAISSAAGGNAEKLSAMVGSTEAVNGIVTLTRGNLEEFTNKVKEMGEASGAQKDAWERFSNTLSASWETLKNTVTNLSIAVGEKLAPGIKAAADAAATWILMNQGVIASGIGEFIQFMGEGIVWLVKSIGGLIQTIGQIEKAWLYVKAGFQAFGAAWNSTLSFMYENTIGFLLKPLEKVFDALQALGKVKVNPLKEISEQLKYAAKISNESFENTAKEIDAIDAKYDKITKTVETVTGGVWKMGDVLKNIAKGSTLTEAFDSAKTAAEKVKPPVDDLVNGMMKLKQGSEDAAKSIGQTLGGLETAKTLGGLEETGQLLNGMAVLGEEISKLSYGEQILAEEAAEAAEQMKNVSNTDFEPMIENTERASLSMRRFHDEAKEACETMSNGFRNVGAEINNVINSWNSGGISSFQTGGSSTADAGYDRYYNQQTRNIGLGVARGMPIYYDPNSASGVGWRNSLSGYATGTGIEGLPKTGPYIGHKGEIVLNSKESEEFRNQKGNTINVNLSPTFLTGDKSMAAKVGEEIATILEKRSKRVSLRTGVN